MIDPNDIQTNSEASVQLPRIITVNDYHDFRHYQNILNHDMGLADVFVTEVGFFDGQYVGLVHLDTENHNQLVLQLEEYYKEEE